MPTVSPVIGPRRRCSGYRVATLRDSLRPPLPCRQRRMTEDDGRPELSVDLVLDPIGIGRSRPTTGGKPLSVQGAGSLKAGGRLRLRGAQAASNVGRGSERV